jgi:hypothetical protein
LRICWVVHGPSGCAGISSRVSRWVRLHWSELVLTPLVGFSCGSTY